ncbi:hypothetical protein D9O50_07660 [Oxalobacteraceae bacterium CAVE-383]|nr:hypothetical protein D9O50_07660 [Oxalobacteraceae bacterium CAVE-383]
MSRLSALRRNRLLQKGALIALAAWSLGATSFAPEGYDPEDQENKVWEEGSVVLPDAPVAANLMEFYVGPTATQTFYIDEKSVSVGGDGVVRYTLVSKSKSGAVNVSYEGIRCATIERKAYAYGGADGSWTKARDPVWRPITELVANRQHAALVKDYFCDVTTVAGNATEIVKRIKYKHPMAPARDYSPGSYNR